MQLWRNPEAKCILLFLQLPKHEEVQKRIAEIEFKLEQAKARKLFIVCMYRSYNMSLRCITSTCVCVYRCVCVKERTGVVLIYVF